MSTRRRGPRPARGKVIVDPELDPALEEEHYVEPPELKERLDIEESQESTGLHGINE